MFDFDFSPHLFAVSLLFANRKELCHYYANKGMARTQACFRISAKWLHRSMMNNPGGLEAKDIVNQPRHYLMTSECKTI